MKNASPRAGIFARREKSHHKLAASGNKKASSEDEAFLFILVGRAGLEPATNGLKVRCSTN